MELLNNLLTQALLPDNQARSNAEKALEAIKKENPNNYALLLCSLLSEQALDPSVKQLATILLKKVVMFSPVSSIWEELEKQTQARLKEQILNLLSQQQDRNGLLKLSDLVSSLGVNVFSKEKEWNDLLLLLKNWTVSQNEFQRESAITILSELLCCPELKTFQKELAVIFQNATADSTVNVRTAALFAITQLVATAPNITIDFAFVCPHIFEVITGCVGKDDTPVLKTLEILVEMVEFYPNALQTYIDNALEILFTIAATVTASDYLRYLSIELVLTLGEHKPAYLRKRTEFLSKFIHLLLSMLMELEENDEWNEGEDADIEDNESHSAVGGASIDRLANSVKDPIIPIIFKEFPGMLSSSDWRHRHSALTTISLIGEGLKDSLSSSLPELMKFILPSFRDPHPRVRWAFCNAIGQMATDFAPNLQNDFHQDIIQALILVMDDVENPRVQSYAAAAIINFCDCEKTILFPYLQPLLSKLQSLLEQQNMIVMLQTVTAIGAVADGAAELFIPYYNQFMPFFKTILFSPNNGADILKLKGKVIEAISLMAAAVGNEVFKGDSAEILKHLFELKKTISDDDPREVYIQRSWPNYCKALGPDFAVYLPELLPSVLEKAKQDADVSLVHSVANYDPEHYNLLQLDKDNTIAIKTSTTNEKISNIQLLYWIVYELKYAFFPCVKLAADVCCGCLTFIYSEAVRTHACHLLLKLFQCVRSAVDDHNQDPDELTALFKYVAPFIVKALSKEIDQEVSIIFLDSFTQMIEFADEDSLSPAELGQIVTASEQFLAKFLKIRKHFLKAIETAKTQGAEESEIEAMGKSLAFHQELFVNVAALIGKCLETTSSDLVPILSKISIIYGQFLTGEIEGVDETELQVAICYFDDLLEHGGELGLKVAQPWIPAVVKNINSPCTDIRQAAVFGLGVLAECHTETFQPFLFDVLNELNRLITAPDSRQGIAVHATENAIGAVGKIIKTFSQVESIIQALPVWLQYLPVGHDEEADDIYKTLCNFCVDFTSIVLGNNFSFFPNLLEIFASALSNAEFVTDKTKKKILAILSQFHTTFPDVFQSAFAAISPSSREILQSF